MQVLRQALVELPEVVRHTTAAAGAAATGRCVPVLRHQVAVSGHAADGVALAA